MATIDPYWHSWYHEPRAEEGRASAKAAAPQDATPQEILKLSAAMWSKLTQKQKLTWEKRSAQEKRDAAKTAHNLEQVKLAKDRELALRRLLAGLDSGVNGALQLADELWPDDSAENSQLFAGLHTVAPARGGNLPVPSWRESGGGTAAVGQQERQKRSAEAINLF
jgi:hypothetical protein